MYKIKIDTTDRTISSVSLFKDAVLVEEIKGEIDVVKAIQEVLEKSKLTLKNISEFGMNEGPGSFTGLKIGAAIINALNWSVLGKSASESVTPIYEPSKFDNHLTS